MPQRVTDITGVKFGRLTVIARTDNDSAGNAYWICKCECGNEVKVRGAHLRRGKTKSCGCLQKEVAHDNGVKNSRYLKGNIPWNKGKRKPLTHRRLKMIWYAIRQRCKNPNCQEYDRYGGRGIALCDEWDKNFYSFYKWALQNGYNNSLTIDRINNDDGYSPVNCRFVTRAEQNRNTSRTHKIYDEHGNVYTASQVAKMVGIARCTAALWFRKYGLTKVSQYKDLCKRLKLKE